MKTGKFSVQGPGPAYTEGVPWLTKNDPNEVTTFYKCKHLKFRNKIKISATAMMTVQLFSKTYLKRNIFVSSPEEERGAGWERRGVGQISQSWGSSAVVQALVC